MEIIKFTPSTDPTTLDQAMVVNGWKSCTWVERYRPAGEFTIEAKVSSGLMDVLTKGSLISHRDTMEVMIVEDQQLSEKEDEQTLVKFTGRSFESFLENRMIGVNQARSASLIAQYSLAAANSWLQIVQMINDHINNPPANANDVITNWTANHSMSGSGTATAQTLPYGELYKAVQDALEVDDLGIRNIRRNPFGVTGGSSTESRMNIYKGSDKTKSVMFTWITGDLAAAEYLFTNRGLKTSALVVGRYLTFVVDNAGTKYNRRFMIVDGQDIDQALTYPPDPGAVATASAQMIARGQQALAKQKDITITQVDLGNNSKYKYRSDYNLGDLVLIKGNYGQTTTMRVTEYAEIHDEDGVTGHPTLSIPGA